MTAITLTCRTCGDTYLLPEGVELRECPSCGTVNCRPAAEGEAFDKLQRATRLRLHGEYAEAENCYRHVLVEYDDDHEALWGKLLCQYGVEFVTDPKTGVRHATVHVPRTKPMQLQADFVRACELAPEAIRAQYETEAALIDEILAEIHGGPGFGEPYDVFICHKTTHLTGPGYTEDYNRGVQLSIRLTQAGCRVFFAPLADLAPGANYEAGIYYALATSKVMLLISSDPAFLTSPWVKSEWSRYLEMLDGGADKHLIPLMYGGMSEARLPKEIRLRGLQTIRMDSDLDAKDKLLAAVAKYTGKGAATPAPTPQPVVTQPVSVEPQPVATAVPQIAPVQPEPVPVYAPARDFEIEEVKGGVAITRYIGSGGEVWIPAAIGGKKVVEIGGRAFEEKKLTGVILPDGLASIRNMAFYGCTSLMSVSIPQSVTSIQDGVFSHCNALHTITVAAGNPSYYAQNKVLFSRDHSLMCYPAGLAATSYRIPEGITSIGMWAFSGCTGLTSVSIPQSVTMIEAWAFSGCTGLTSIILPDRVSTIEAWVFSGCTGLTSVSLPRSVTSISERAFKGCTGLTSVSLPQSVTSIGARAFEDCPGLTSISLPQSVASIGSMAFNGCTGLTNISIPQSVTSIGERAFFGCTSLTLRVHPNTFAHTYAQEKKLRFELIGPAVKSAPSAFGIAYTPAGHFVTKPSAEGVSITQYIAHDSKLSIPPVINGKPVTEIAAEAFRGNVFLENVIVPEGVQYIGESAFRSCTNLQHITLPESLSTISGNAFQGCRSLQEINLPKRIMTIASYTFNACTSLREVVLPEKVVIIGESAFDYCTSLTSVTLPAGLRSIGAMAFYRCAELSKINLPEGVKLGKDVFGQCRKLPNAITKKSSTGFAGFLDKILPIK